MWVATAQTPVTQRRREVGGGGGPAPGALVGEGGPGSIGSNEGPPHPRLVWVRGTFTQSPPGRAAVDPAPGDDRINGPGRSPFSTQTRAHGG